MNRAKATVVTLAALGLVLLPLLDDPYLDRLATLGAIYAILALGLNLTAGHLGLFDFGYVVYFGIAGYTTALLTLRAEWPYLLALLVSMLVAGLAGAVIAAIVLRLRGAYFVIATFSFLTVVYYVAINWVRLTNGPLGLIGVPAASINVPLLGELRTLDPRPALEFPLAGLALAALLVWRLTASTEGRVWQAIRDNEDLAASVGMDATRHAFIGLVASALLGGLAGSLYAQYLGIVTPEIFAFSHMVDVLLMVVIGGTGTFFGPIAGAFLVVSLPEFLRVAESYRLPIFGLILIVIILFAPQGLASLNPRAIARRARGARAVRWRRAAEDERASAEG